MRAIPISTEVFARIWSLREAGEETEDAILRRVLLGKSQIDSAAVPFPSPTAGLIDRRSGVHFPEGFEIFRTYLGTDYRAQASEGHWVLRNDGRPYGSLNELSQAIGAKIENAWVNWFFLGPDGARKPVSDLRDPSKISRRKAPQGSTAGSAEGRSAYTDSGSAGTSQTDVGDVTWRDDVRDALLGLGRKASLHQIYKEVERTRRLAGRSTPPTLEAVVRRTLEDHSSDSSNYRGGPNLFSMPEGRGAGVWALRN
jgi:hypothetical protein